jgi:hypothetical protein
MAALSIRGRCRVISDLKRTGIEEAGMDAFSRLLAKS